MATTSLNPGVGPTNADIATAVAAPSAATIAAAVAAPSAATIASAVAAPSSATIATAVAAAVPTTAGITTIVQANAGSPVGGTWTNLGRLDLNGLQGATISSLSGYKYLKFFFGLSPGVTGMRLQLRFNGDTGSNYWFGLGSTNSAGPDEAGSQIAQTQITLHGSASVNNRVSGIIEIENSNSGIYKMTKTTSAVNYSSSRASVHVSVGCWNNTAAITSVTFLNHYPSTYEANNYIWCVGGN
jgi:hypothetical protein